MRAYGTIQPPRSGQEVFDIVYRHLLTQNARAEVQGLSNASISCRYRAPGGLKCAIGCLIPDSRYREDFEGKRVTFDPILGAAGLNGGHLDLAEDLQDCHDNTDVSLWETRLRQIAKDHKLTVPASIEPIRTVQRSRQERLISLSSNGSICIETVARLLDCPEASIRRDIFHLREAGWYITLEDKQIRCHGKRTALLASQEDADV